MDRFPLLKPHMITLGCEHVCTRWKLSDLIS